MSKTETAGRCVAECRGCGKIFPAELRGDGSPRPIGIGACTCGGDEFRQVNG